MVITVRAYGMSQTTNGTFEIINKQLVTSQEGVNKTYITYQFSNSNTNLELIIGDVHIILYKISSDPEIKEIGLINSSIESFALKLSDMPNGFYVDSEISEIQSSDEQYSITEKYIVDFKNDENYVIKQQILKFRTKENTSAHYQTMLSLFYVVYNATFVTDYSNTFGDGTVILDGMAASITYGDWRQIIVLFRLSNVIVSIEVEYKTSEGNSEAIQSAFDYAQIVEGRIISTS